MAYAKLQQILALAKTRPQSGSLIMPAVPQLSGKLAAIAPDDVRQFNAQMQQAFQELQVRVDKLVGELQLAATQEQVAVEPAEDGDDGASAYQIAVANGFVGSETAWLESLKGEDGNSGGSNVSIGSVLDPNGVFVGSPGDFYKSTVALGGDGSLWVKVSGTNTTTVWE